MKASLAPLMSSKNQSWETPDSVFTALEKIYGPFDLDGAASHDNFKCFLYCTEEGLFQSYPSGPFLRYGTDGLAARWHTIGNGKVWLNPEYSNCAEWIRKAYEESQLGATVVCLIPSRTDTKYWHDYVMKASEVLLVKGRIRFVGAAASAPFPSAVVVFRPGSHVPHFQSWSVPK